MADLTNEQRALVDEGLLLAAKFRYEFSANIASDAYRDLRAHLERMAALAQAEAQPEAVFTMEQFGGLVGLARDHARERAVVYKATNHYGETCHFGVGSLAHIWAKHTGKVEEVPLRDLRLVSAPQPAAPAPALRRNLHVSPDADDGYTDYAAPAPETVAWMVYTKDGKSVFVTDNPTDIPAECAALPLFTSPPAAPAPEPVAWIEHHKAGDNLLWDEPGGKKTALYAHPAPVAAPAPETVAWMIVEPGCEYGPTFSTENAAWSALTKAPPGSELVELIRRKA